MGLDIGEKVEEGIWEQMTNNKEFWKTHKETTIKASLKIYMEFK